MKYLCQLLILQVNTTLKCPMNNVETATSNADFFVNPKRNIPKKWHGFMKGSLNLSPPSPPPYAGDFLSSHVDLPPFKLEESHISPITLA